MPIKKRPIITIGIIAINILVFVWLSFFGMTEDGSYMLEHGAMFVPLVLGNHEYYRLITSIFLHFGFAHLMNNMVMSFFPRKYIGGGNRQFQISFIIFCKWRGREHSVSVHGPENRRICHIGRCIGSDFRRNWSIVDYCNEKSRSFANIGRKRNGIYGCLQSVSWFYKHRRR